MRRIIFCGLYFFPRQGAHSNYIQYLADAVKREGYEVEMLCGINKEYSSADEMRYHDIHVTELYYRGNIFLERLFNGKLWGLRLKRKLKALNLNKEDLIIFSSLLPLTGAINSLKKKYGFKTATTVLEWFDDKDYFSARDAYIGRKQFEMNSENDLLFPISHKIAEHFPNNKCFILPIMADSQEYECIEKKEGKYIFVFPAKGIMKDALSEMLMGLALLSDNELEKIQFHIMGIEKTKIISILKDDYKRLRDKLVIHDWMEYADLVDLYQKAHYLFLAREFSQMTESNFPSKVPETMTYGIVPVASRVGDYTKYYLKNCENSIIFDGCDSHTCMKALQEAISIPFEDYKILSHNARKCVEDKFDYRNWSGAIKEAIESIF
jgi:glycosyltransferase involved in cell wall biosynthesis